MDVERRESWSAADGPPAEWYEIQFNANDYLDKLFPDRGEWGLRDDADDAAFEQADQAARAKYAETLSRELQTVVESGSVEAVPPRTVEPTVAGPGAELDIVRLMFEVGAGYVTFKEVAKDVRRVVERLRTLAGADPRIDEGAAMLLAVDHLVEPNTASVIDIRFVAPMRTAGEFPDTAGWIVGLKVDGDDKTVLLDTDGKILGVVEQLGSKEFGVFGF